MPNHYGENQIDQNKKQWSESVYKFTQPVRYFKNNDPYHWEIDNIPIKQLEENILWLKDQFVSDTELSGIERKDFAELRPLATGSSRTVRVQKGRFTARINDAYNKGFQTLIKTANATVDPGGPLERGYKFDLPTEVLKQIAGDVVGEALYFNGLYEHLQHHDVNSNVANLSWLATTLTSINSIPKNRLAVWRQGDTMATGVERLNELAVSFTRRWGGAIRTAVVNVNEDLEIAIPPFSTNDYSNKTGFQPAVRADLLFIYSHPIDAETTTIAKPDGDNPTVISAPRLGLLKGAGVISLKGYGNFDNYESNDEDDGGFFDGVTFTSNLSNENGFFRSDEPISDEDFYQTISPLADLVSSESDLTETSVNFPSPDDVMNLTPLFQEGLENSFALVGQSILPIAYVITQKGKTTITSDDIIDIRPFLRTTELSYNERSGVAAANPPLSFANPAVGKTELDKVVTRAVTKLKTYVDTTIGDLATGTGDGGGTVIGNPSYVLTRGTIFGGTNFGVEGSLLEFGSSVNDSTVDLATDAGCLSYLQRYYPGLQEIPKLPGWDLATWTLENNGAGLGELRNDRIDASVRIGDTKSFYVNSAASEAVRSQLTDLVKRIDNNRFGTFIAGINSAYNNNNDSFDTCYFIKKKLKVALPDEALDYDVQCNFRNCVGQSTHSHRLEQNVMGSQRFGSLYNGITVEKGPIQAGEAEFTIFVAIAPPQGAYVNYPEIDTNSSTQSSTKVHEDMTINSDDFQNVNFFAPMCDRSSDAQRRRDIFSSFRVLWSGLHDESYLSTAYNNLNQINPQNPNGNYTNYTVKTLPASLVTYPTVDFTVVAYNNTFGTNYISDIETVNASNSIT